MTRYNVYQTGPAGLVFVTQILARTGDEAVLYVRDDLRRPADLALTAVEASHISSEFARAVAAPVRP